MPASRHRLITVILALLCLLSMQLAVAGYACPHDSGRPAPAMAVADMPCADEMPSVMDAEQSHLCHAHCQSSHQTAEKARSAAPVAMAVGFTYTLEPVPAATPARAPRPPSLLRVTEPALAVRNCCLRL